MAGRRICAGYYRRYDGKVVYVISTATDNDTREETVIWTTYPFADVPKYCTSTKKSFCAFVEVDGERKAKYKRLMNMKISEAAIERLEDEGFRGPVRKQHRRQLEEEYDSRVSAVSHLPRIRQRSLRALQLRPEQISPLRERKEGSPPSHEVTSPS